MEVYENILPFKEKGKEKHMPLGPDKTNNFISHKLVELKVFGIDVHPDSITVMSPTTRETLGEDVERLLFRSFLSIYKCSKRAINPEPNPNPDINASSQDIDIVDGEDITMIISLGNKFAQDGIHIVASEWAPKVRWTDLLWSVRSSRLISDRLERM